MAATVAAEKRRVESERGPLHRESLTAYAFLIPWVVGMLVFFLGPLLFSAYLSGTDWNLQFNRHWIGADNFREMATEDYRFWQSLKVTISYLAISVPVYLVFGLLGAVLLNQRVWGIRAFRTILFLPSVLSGVAVSVLWLQLLNPDAGVVNTLLRNIGISHPPAWFEDPSWAVPAMVLTNLWSVVGGGAIIYLAGLQNVNPQLLESATVDGAGAVRRFVWITIPMLSPTLFFTLLTSIIGAFQVFDTAYTVTGAGGGTSDSLLFYLLYVWQSGFRDGRIGYAAALSWVLFVVGACVVVLLMRTSERWVYYESERG
jgi:multiple sugar transport system permease protein